jgi:hypothetical protein
MPNITADKVVNHLMYAKTNVNAYEPGGKIVVKTFLPGQLIGNVYSYIEIGNDLYWLFYLTPADYNNFNAVYVKHDSSKLSLPDLPAILDQIAAEKKAAIIAKDGVFSYYLQTYLPYIVGAVVVAIALPSIVKSVKK